MDGVGQVAADVRGDEVDGTRRHVREGLSDPLEYCSGCLRICGVEKGAEECDRLGRSDQVAERGPASPSWRASSAARQVVLNQSRKSS